IKQNVNYGATTLTVGGAGNTSFSGTVTGNGKLIKDGAGVFTLSGNNISSGWTGKIEVRGGVLAWSSDNGSTNNLGAGPTSVIPDYIIVDGGTLRDTTSDTSGTSFVRTNRGIQLTANG